ncbi:MAG: hypothetical protein B6I32_00130 [Desulfobacterium sp. 4572_20]|nr:MAG: hypothetical protein B6I32_00130 [Desulfobacterium sp. 4572_20]
MKKPRKSFIKNLTYLCLVGVVALGLLTIVGTGGGGGDGTSTSTTEGTTTFNSGGTIGDLLTYTIDTSVSPMTYSYEIVESDFGLDGTTGSGTLTKNADGTYTPSNDPKTNVILLANTLIVGGADVDVGGTETTMLFTGVPALTTNYTASEIAGTYNYINFECGEALSNNQCTEGYKSFYGTFKLETSGTWEACESGDIDDQGTNSCAGIDNGTWTDQGNGRITVTSSGGATIGTAMLLPSGSGGKVIIIDLKDRPGLGAGPGILVGVKKQDIANENLGGTYHFNDDDGGYGDVTVDNTKDTWTGTHYDSNGNPTPISGSIARNAPWNGWLTDSNNNLILILPSDGVWFQTADSPNNDWITMGGAIP